MTTVILWQNIEMSLSENERIISVAGTIGHTDPKGFSLRYLEKDTQGHERMHEVSIHHTMALEGYETEEQASAYLLERYPDAERCEVYLALNEEGSIVEEDNLYVVVEKDAVHGYFTSWSGACVIEERLDYDRNMEEDAHWMGAVRYVLEQLDYDDSADCVWQKQETEQGSFWVDYEAGRFYMEQDVGTGERFRFFAKRVEVPPEEDFPERVYREVQMTIFREAEQEPFQEFTVYSGETYREYPFLMFEDFNMDGFLDLKVIGYTAAGNESADHYVWSLSAGCFTESLSTFGRYGTNAGERKLCERVHGSASSGSLYLYQWENEADYELIKYMDYDFDDTGDVIEIGRYVNGEKETLISYPEDRPYIDENAPNPAGLFLDDLVWEMSITDKDDGKSYRIYYAQELQYDEDGEKTGRFEGRLYVVDDTLALYSYLGWEESSDYTEILWDDTGGEEALVIRYMDNRQKEWSVTELLQKTR